MPSFHSALLKDLVIPFVSHDQEDIEHNYYVNSSIHPSFITDCMTEPSPTTQSHNSVKECSVTDCNSPSDPNNVSNEKYLKLLFKIFKKKNSKILLCLC